MYTHSRYVHTVTPLVIHCPEKSNKCMLSTGVRGQPGYQGSCAHVDLYNKWKQKKGGINSTHTHHQFLNWVCSKSWIHVACSRFCCSFEYWRRSFSVSITLDEGSSPDRCPHPKIALFFSCRWPPAWYHGFSLRRRRCTVMWPQRLRYATSYSTNTGLTRN